LYDAPARSLVLAWKERGRRDLTELLAGIVGSVVDPPDSDAVTFVPGDRDRVLRRGHSPPERLAWVLASLWRLPLQPLLVRSHHAPQRGLPLSDRLSNVAGAFSAFGAVPKSVVLVDDVYTTGSTANACAGALRRAGADRVDVICVARAVR